MGSESLFNSHPVMASLWLHLPHVIPSDVHKIPPEREGANPKQLNYIRETDCDSD